MDPITDIFNRIKNAQSVHKQTVDIPFSKIKYKITQILAKGGFIEKSEAKGRKTRKVISVTLKYIDDIPFISDFKRISKPGQRIYLPHNEIRKVRGGYGMTIISTSKGLMAGKEAKKKKIGGEVICEVW